MHINASHEPLIYLRGVAQETEETLTNHPKLIGTFAPLFKMTPHFDSFVSDLLES